MTHISPLTPCSDRSDRERVPLIGTFAVADFRFADPRSIKARSHCACLVPKLAPWLEASQLRDKTSFYLVRHADDRRLERQNRFAAALVEGFGAEVARPEAQA